MKDEITLAIEEVLGTEFSRWPDEDQMLAYKHHMFFDWTGIKNTEETKLLKSQRTKEFWDSEEGQEKKIRLIEKNKTTHKQVMLEKWQNPSEAMINRQVHGRPKGAKDIKQRKQRTERKIWVDGKIYNSAKECSDVYGIDPVNVRRRCRLPQYNDWRYVDESCTTD